MTASMENPHAGQGSVLLDIGGDVGALVVTMPAELEGIEVEIRPHGHGTTAHRSAPDDVHRHHPHVAVVNRPVVGGSSPSLVFPELVEGHYELCTVGTDDIVLTVEIHGAEVTTATWPE